MKAQTISLILAISLIFSASCYSVNAQITEPADHIVINEVETNPPGKDHQTISERVEIYNPTSESVDISGWQIASTAISKKTLVLPAGTVIEQGQFLAYSYLPLWFIDTSESVELRDSGGDVIDETPSLRDTLNDATSWQRVYDGVDGDTDSDWVFKPSSMGIANNNIEKIIETKTVTATINSESPSYVFGDTAVLKGSVSEMVFVEKPLFRSEPINIRIAGPNYFNEITQYPDRDLEYSTSIALHKVLGINEGVYDVSVEYAGFVDYTQFSVEDAADTIEQKDIPVLSLFVDNEDYLPGSTVTLWAHTTEEIPLEGLQFTVIDAYGREIEYGSLFPSSDINRSVRGGTLTANPDAQFTTSFFIDTVDPVYGTYQVSALYHTQTAQTSFEVTEVTKDDEGAIVSLTTDKNVYEPGDVIVISGRANQHWVPALNIEILKSTNLALGVLDFEGGGTGLKILDVVRLKGDSTFSYEIDVPSYFESFGEYRVTVSGELGQYITKFIIVKDASTHVYSDEPFAITTDKKTYNIGETVKITGAVRDQIKRSSFETVSVMLDIRDAAGNILSINKFPDGSNARTNNQMVDLSFVAIPDPTGNFMSSIELARTFYYEGTYTIIARYNNMITATPITVVDPLNLGSIEITASLDKDVYGLGDVLMLTGRYDAQSTDGQGVVLTIYKPDGDSDIFGTNVDGGAFSWEWDAPTSKVSSGSANERVVSKSNLGTYRLNIEIDSNDKDLYFIVSDDPQNDALNVEPITLFTDKQVYRLGDKLNVYGDVVVEQLGREGLVVPRQVHIQVLSNMIPYNPVNEARVYPDQGGRYSSTFELPIGVFSEGTHKIKTMYNKELAYTEFVIGGNTMFGDNNSDSAELILDLQKDVYYPGQTVVLTGNPNKIIYAEVFEISVIRESQQSIDCSSFRCIGQEEAVTSIRPDSSAGFTYNYEIPETDSIGSYEIVVDAGFDTKSVMFNVIKEPAKIPSRIIDKVNHITESQILIAPESKTSEGYELIPRVISGSLLTSIRGQESAVNLQVTSPDGTCIIGQSEQCMVSNSTRARGTIYSTVSFDGNDYKVRYSGADVTFEKFSILPASADDALPTEPFVISVIKDEQPTKFYYKITYIPPQSPPK